MSATVHTIGQLDLEDAELREVVTIAARSMEIPVQAVEAGLAASLTLREIALELDRSPAALELALVDGMSPQALGDDVRALLDQPLRLEWH
jgi:hypothetical protein